MSRVDEQPPVRGDELKVAVIGMAVQLPGAGESLDAFWRNLATGSESIARFDDRELLAAGVEPELLTRSSYVKARPVIEGEQLFDAALFGCSPNEARRMDPQHRLMLEAAWRALEHAGYDSFRFAGKIGVYAACGKPTYLVRNVLPTLPVADSADAFEALIGNEKDYLAPRLSYKLDLRGPSLGIQSACSSSLAAVHVAVQALLAGECEMALAGGVSISVPQRTGHLYSEGGLFSRDGHCRVFHRDSCGTIFGNGLGLVVLKRLPEALADRDTVWAVIAGSAMNNDGAAKVGYTAPSASGQRAVIAEALAMAGVGPEAVTLIEAHGTGTALGDRIELAALSEVFCSAPEPLGGRALGSVKENVGHLGTAAGVAGLIKTILALRHRTLPPSPHPRAAPPNMDLSAGSFFIPESARPWEAPAGQPRRAGVSSFAVGGTNVHVVLEEAAEPASALDSGPELLVLSAATPSALARAAVALADELEQRLERRLGDVAFTQQVGRRELAHRFSLVCRGESAEERRSAIERLRQLAGSPSSALPWPVGAEESRLAALGRRWEKGEAISWEELARCRPVGRVPLPTYPFERERFWIDPPARVGVVAAAPVARPRGEDAVARLFCHVLGLARVAEDGDFFLLGGDSLSAVQLVADLQRELGVSVSLARFFENPTVADLRRLIAGSGGHGAEGAVSSRGGERQKARQGLAPPVLAADVRAEAALLEAREEPSDIFLTGATGFLGSHLLHDLLCKTDARIHCLVRACTESVAAARLRERLATFGLAAEGFEKRVVPILGDLAEPLLGLSSEAHGHLARKVDAVYHCGSRVHYQLPYERLAPTNVQGGEEVLRFACRIVLKRVHFVSSVAVFSPPEAGCEAPVLETDDPGDSPPARSSGYAQSKWAAEKLALEASRRGLPITIYRPGRIAGHSTTGHWHNSDLVHQFLRACVALESAPYLDLLFDLSPIDYVSGALVHLSRNQATPAHAFHLVNPRPRLWREVVELLRQLGHRLEVLPPQRWRERLAQLDYRQHNLPLPAPYLFATDGPTAGLPRERREQNVFDCRHTAAGLAGTNIRCPELDAELLRRYLGALVTP